MFWCALPARCGRHAGDEVVGAQVGEHRDLRVEQRHVDGLALAGGVAVAQRGEDGDRGVHAGEQVGHGDADLLRPAAGRVVGDLARPGHAHQAAHALHGVVVAGAVAVGAGLAEAGDRAVDEARVEGEQAGRVQAVARHVADLEVLDEHVAAAAARRRISAWPSGARDVDRDRALVAVGAEVVGGLGGVVAVAVLAGRAGPSRACRRRRLAVAQSGARP